MIEKACRIVDCLLPIIQESLDQFCFLSHEQLGSGSSMRGRKGAVFIENIMPKTEVRTDAYHLSIPTVAYDYPFAAIKFA